MNFEKTIVGLMGKFGRDVYIGYKASADYNVATGEVGGTDVEYLMKGMVSDYTAYAYNGGLIQQGDKKVVVGAKSDARIPQIGDTVRIDGEYWAIVGVSEKGMDKTYSWELQVRRG